MTDFDHVKDSGTRQEFETGAVRDARSGKGRYDLVLALPHMLYRLARHFENGAVKYGDDNWRKGLPLRRFIDSAFRHLCQFMAGATDEDHLTAVVWNLMCHGETANEIAAGRLPVDLNDMPSGVWGAEPTPETPRDVDPEDGPISVGGLALEMKDIPPFAGTVHSDVRGETIHVPTWYIAGPMRGYPESNFPAFDKAARLMAEAGLVTISPANMDRVAGFNPETDELTPEVLRGIIQRDLEVILGLRPEWGDGLILLPGWEQSVGCQAEVPLALWLGLKFKEVFPEAVEFEFFSRDMEPEEVRERLFYQNLDEVC